MYADKVMMSVESEKFAPMKISERFHETELEEDVRSQSNDVSRFATLCLHHLIQILFFFSDICRRYTRNSCDSDGTRLGYVACPRRGHE